MRAIKTIRSQHSIGSSSGFGGPDTYVAVLLVPDGVEVPGCNNRRVLAQRGIRFIYCGEGYPEHRGPRSMLGQAIAKADRIVEEN